MHLLKDSEKQNKKEVKLFHLSIQETLEFGVYPINTDLSNACV